MATVFSLDAFTAAPPLEQVKAVSQGLPAKAVRDLVADRIVTLADVARVVSPRRTIDRRLKHDERFSPEESDRLARFLNILLLAAQVLGDRAAAMRWLNAPKRRFDGKTPIELVKTDAGARMVEQLLGQASHGFNA